MKYLRKLAVGMIMAIILMIICILLAIAIIAFTTWNFDVLSNISWSMARGVLIFTIILGILFSFVIEESVIS